MKEEPKKPDARITAAKADRAGLFVQVNGVWARVDSQEWLLEIPICILIDQDASLYFTNNFSAFWPGNLAENNMPYMVTGGTENLIIAAIFEDYLARSPVLEETALPVPSLAQAAANLPDLRAARHARDGDPAKLAKAA
jgi:hypothetical protein